MREKDKSNREQDKLPDALPGGCCWVICPVSATLRSCYCKRLLCNKPLPPYCSHLLYDCTISGCAVSKTWPEVFSLSPFVLALYLALVAQSTPNYANRLLGIGKAPLTQALRGRPTASEQGRLLPCAWVMPLGTLVCATCSACR